MIRTWPPAGLAWACGGDHTRRRAQAARYRGGESRATRAVRLRSLQTACTCHQGQARARSPPGGEGSAVPQLEPGHRPPATPSPAPPRSHSRHQAQPPAAFRITASGTQLRRPGTAAIGDFHPDDATAGHHRDRDRLPGSPNRLYRTLLPKSSLTSKTATSPHGCPGPSTAPTNSRATRARSARPASVTLSRTAAPVITAPALPGLPCPGEPPGPLGWHMGMHARLSGTRQAATRRRRGRPWLSVESGPSVAVRGKSTVSPTVLCGRTPSAICPWTPQHAALQRPKVTHPGTEKKRPASTRIRS